MNPNTASYNSLSILIFLVIVFILLFLIILGYFIFSWSSCFDNIYWDVWLLLLNEKQILCLILIVSFSGIR